MYVFAVGLTICNKYLFCLYYCFETFISVCRRTAFSLAVYNNIILCNFFLYFISGWTGDSCDIPDCPGGCEGNGFCNGTDRDIPECDCKDVSTLYKTNLQFQNM